MAIAIDGREIVHSREEIELCNRYSLLHSTSPSLVPGGFFFVCPTISQSLVMAIAIDSREIVHSREEIELCNRYSLLHSTSPSLVPGGFFLLFFQPIVYS